MTKEELIALIESLLHCMRDTERGIGCNGCKSNVGGKCILANRLEKYDEWRYYRMLIEAMEEVKA